MLTLWLARQCTRHQSAAPVCWVLVQHAVMAVRPKTYTGCNAGNVHLQRMLVEDHDQLPPVSHLLPVMSYSCSQLLHHVCQLLQYLSWQR